MYQYLFELFKCYRFVIGPRSGHRAELIDLATDELGSKCVIGIPKRARRHTEVVHGAAYRGLLSIQICAPERRHY